MPEGIALGLIETRGYAMYAQLCPFADPTAVYARQIGKLMQSANEEALRLLAAIPDRVHWISSELQS